MNLADFPDFSGKHIFITGGAGFIGSSLIGAIIEHNKVTVYDNFSRDALKFKPYRNHPNLNIVHGDILDPEALKTAIQGATHVVHAAGIAGIDTVIRNPVQTMKVNMIGSSNLLEAAATLDHCERVICFSTSEVFGQVAFRANESNATVLGAVGEARWTYAVSKLAEEHLTYAHYKEFGLPTVIIRPFNIYGPGQIGEGAIKTMIELALQNQTIQVHGSGTQIRAWCYVDDMVEGIMRCLTVNAAVGESFNLGNESTIITIYGLANTIVRVLGSKSPIQYQAKDTVDVELRIPELNKARQVLGFQAKIDLEEGIKLTAAHIRQEMDNNSI
ncbi:NAD-dependent epimerase/dehydratase family protein [Paenibacillus sp. FSL H8-0122]|uniref:NAD-dependent epimerase/dehydratase family protein n=1 Tax=Paenibacillus sp. FSL H8-0122 TaxID=2954510 RepID=UPI0030F887B0